MKTELILIPSESGGCQIFRIPKKQMELHDGKQYRLFIEEIE